MNPGAAHDLHDTSKHHPTAEAEDAAFLGANRLHRSHVVSVCIVLGCSLGCAGARDPVADAAPQQSPFYPSPPHGVSPTQPVLGSQDNISTLPAAPPQPDSPAPGIDSTSADDDRAEEIIDLTQPAAGSGVFVNGFEVADAGGVPPGRYWYDPQSGYYGFDGYRSSGVVQAGLPVERALRADASLGTSELFLNGRELTDVEAAELQWFLWPALGGELGPGRYGLDGFGNFGFEGQPAAYNLPWIAVIYWGVGVQGDQGNASWSKSNSFGNAAGACFDDTGCVFY